MEKIDFVITWVDGSDSNWISKRNSFAELLGEKRISSSLYRDWGFLKYWFRSIEKFAPWVNKIFLVTDDQIPNWLNIGNEKLVVVSHRDIIPADRLPTFNSMSIEPYLYKIPSLSEKFVYFNDDTFLNKTVKPKLFFKKNLPCDFMIFETLCPSSTEDQFSHYIVNNISIINESFSKKTVIRKNFFKVFNFKYGVKNFKNLYFLFQRKFSAFSNSHMPQPFLKSTFASVWHKYFAYLDSTTKNRFRNCTDVNPYVFRYWQLVTGNFVPISPKIGKLYDINQIAGPSFYNDFINCQHSLICINDNLRIENIEELRLNVSKLFEKKFPKKSSFEK